MKYYAYVLMSLSTENRYYGSTSNLEQRLRQHNQGKSLYTRGRGPWKLLYYEEFNTRSKAVKREKFLKSGKGREYLNQTVMV